MTSRIKLYDTANIDQYVWPDSDYGRYAKQYLLPLLAEGSERFVRNVRTRLLVLDVDGIPLPITVNEKEYDNSYVCSPYTHYVSYAKQELVLLGNRALIGCLDALLSGVGCLLKRADFNRIVHVNNWLLSTNLSPELAESQWAAVLDKLLALFPGHAIAFRSLCPSLNKRTIDSLQSRGCILVPSRQIYLLRTGETGFGSAKSRWLLKRDGALAAKGGYARAGPDDMADSDIPRIAELYRLLYLEKYSRHNPQFTERYLKEALHNGILELHGFRRDGRLDAVLGFYFRGDAMTTPLFGYDTSLPQQLGLYRMLSARLIEIACERRVLLHESSGAAQFKRNRGAEAEIEYTAVQVGHLPLRRRVPWTALADLLTKIGVPLLRKYKL
ncbi:GNAT family N-acetyltransferase [Cohnella phaseoli]|uniref:Acetyltransferase (GNAT) family protein n=1 Tax=Cohnella phaseoli TaxID=456490 RepID=A0A3D9IFZ6_9BACL|nr:GNAT family N-acetyltransferase [Cohnella phaseoli]RED60692.1 acetyltransferase (GNAT) family protein [Cohnella phaseoli]